MTAFLLPILTGMDIFPAFSSDAISRILFTFKTAVESKPQLNAGSKA